MQIGTTIRNMGGAATADTITRCAEHAEQAELDHVWVVDHLAIPPDDAEGSDGLWLDAFTTLTWIAARTRQIAIGTAIVVLPYRPAFVTAKWAASLQELSGGRLRLGVGAGWMRPEFQALGVDPGARGALTDAAIELIQQCFDATDDLVELNGQAILFRPRPTRPPLYVGGMSDAAMRRAARHADTWLPMGLNAEKLAERRERLAGFAEAVGRPCPKMTVMGRLPDSQDEAVERMAQLAAAGASEYIQSSRYTTVGEFDEILARLRDLQRQLDGD